MWIRRKGRRPFLKTFPMMHSALGDISDKAGRTKQVCVSGGTGTMQGSKHRRTSLFGKLKTGNLSFSQTSLRKKKKLDNLIRAADKVIR